MPYLGKAPWGTFETVVRAYAARPVSRTNNKCRHMEISLTWLRTDLVSNAAILAPA
jgi:hypothetical protein